MSTPETLDFSYREGNFTRAKAIQPGFKKLYDDLLAIWQKPFEPDLDAAGIHARALGEINMAWADALVDLAQSHPLTDFSQETVAALFAIIPEAKKRHEARDSGDISSGSIPIHIEQFAGMSEQDFVKALSVAAIVNWMPFIGRLGPSEVRLHQVSDPAGVINRLEQGAAFKPPADSLAAL